MLKIWKELTFLKFEKSDNLNPNEKCWKTIFIQLWKSKEWLTRDTITETDDGKWIVKIMILGDENVGKRCLRHRFLVINNFFQIPINRQENLTLHKLHHKAILAL